MDYELRTPWDGYAFPERTQAPVTAIDPLTVRPPVMRPAPAAEAMQEKAPAPLAD